MIKELPDISIIVPVYKVETYIERCAKSLFEQTFDNLEYIFVNDCTPDKSIEILCQVLALYPHRVSQVKIINHETNQGVATTRNTGLTHATGRYIGWVDSDDWVETNMFEQLYNVSERYNADFVWCDYYFTLSDNQSHHSQYCEENRTSLIKSLLVGRIHGALWFSIAKKELYIQNNIRFPEGLNVMEDKVVLIKLLYFSHTIKYIPKAYYYYVKDTDHSITSQWGRNWRGQEAAKTNLLAILDFLNHSDLRIELQKYMKYAKLIFKKGLLNTLDLQSFHYWKELFAEANQYVLLCPNMTFRQKILGWSISHDWRVVPIMWIRFKKNFIFVIGI